MINEIEVSTTPKRPHLSDSSEDSFTVFAKPPVKKTTTTNMADLLIRGELDTLSFQIGELNSETAIIKDNMSQIEIVHYLVACVSKQQTMISKLSNEVLDLKARSMRNNILIHNVPEQKEENHEQKVRDALTEMKINHGGVEFDRVHRIGEYRANARKPRPIVAQCMSSKMTTKLLKQRPKWEEKEESEESAANATNAPIDGATEPNLMESEDTVTNKAKNKDPWISPQYPPETLGENRAAKDFAKKYKEAHPQANVFVKRNKTYVNGNYIAPAVVKPQINDLLDMNTKEHEELKKLYKFTPVQDVKVEGVTVRAFKCNKDLDSINQIRGAYKSFLLDSGRVKAAYNALAYKIGDANGYVDDGSGGMGRTMLKTFIDKKSDKNCVLFMTQFHTTNIGFAKFESAVKLTKTYLEKFKK